MSAPAEGSGIFPGFGRACHLRSARAGGPPSVSATPTLATVRERAQQDGLCVLGLRFTADRGVPGERFATLRRELGDAFLAVEIDSSPGNPYGIPQNAHSVLTQELVDEPGHPTRDALNRVLAFYRERLHT